MARASFLSKVFLEHGYELVKLGNFRRWVQKETEHHLSYLTVALLDEKTLLTDWIQPVFSVEDP